ncbi:lysozyme [Variovorax sp. 38R]|nr:lysozyme [Variovorax sp. 38R]
MTMAAEKRYFPHLAGSLVLASAGLLGLLGKWEGGKQYVVYADKLAGGLPTVCKGLTRHVTSTPIIVGERWSAEQCEREERAALIHVQLQLAQCFKLLPPQDVFDAGGSHAWNFGAPSTCSSGAMAAWNRGEWVRGCQRLSRSDDGKLVWSFTSRIDPKTGAKVYTFVQGLANRRADETRYCVGGRT